MKFRADFGAKDEARLEPCKDDKPKDAGITLFKAGSVYCLSAHYIYIYMILYFRQIFKYF